RLMGGGLIAPTVKAVNRSPAKHIQPPPGRDAPDHVIEIVRLRTMHAPGGHNRGRQALRVHKHGLAFAGIEGELGIELRESYRLHAPRFDPDKLTYKVQTPCFQAGPHREEKTMRRPEPHMGHIREG